MPNLVDHFCDIIDVVQHDLSKGWLISVASTADGRSMMGVCFFLLMAGLACGGEELIR